MKRTIKQRFMAMVSKSPQTNCWLWNGCKVRGYGSFRKDGKTKRAHRSSFEIFVGDIPPGHGVLHRCDTPACVNPDHLFTGTQIDNSRDMFKKNRRHILKGIEHGMARLTIEQISEIRRDYTPKRGALSKLAKKYDVYPSHIHKIINNQLWRTQ